MSKSLAIIGVAALIGAALAAAITLPALVTGGGDSPPAALSLAAGGKPQIVRAPPLPPAAEQDRARAGQPHRWIALDLVRLEPRHGCACPDERLGLAYCEPDARAFQAERPRQDDGASASRLPLRLLRLRLLPPPAAASPSAASAASAATSAAASASSTTTAAASAAPSAGSSPARRAAAYPAASTAASAFDRRQVRERRPRPHVEVLPGQGRRARPRPRLESGPRLQPWREGSPGSGSGTGTGTGSGTRQAADRTTTATRATRTTRATARSARLPPWPVSAAFVAPAPSAWLSPPGTSGGASRSSTAARSCARRASYGPVVATKLMQQRKRRRPS